eukprot:gene34505-42552_t
MAKLGTIRAIGHNFADSFASGIGLLVGYYTMDVFAEAASSAEGFILVDFMNATTAGSPVSASLARAIRLYREVLPEFCAKHGVELDDINAFQVRFGTDAAYGRHFLVTVENSSGRRSAGRLKYDFSRTSAVTTPQPSSTIVRDRPGSAMLRKEAP